MERYGMIKYNMVIDNEVYKALFENSFEAIDFINEVVSDGDKVTITSIEYVNGNDILADTDFSYSYKVEMLATMLLPNHRDFKKWEEQEVELRRLGYIA